MDRQPTLRGALLELRPLVAEDFDALYAVASDPLIWEQHPDSDRYQPAVFRAFFSTAMASGGALAAIDIASGRIIGSSRFCELDAERNEIEIGWTFLARAFWGGRYNREMKTLMMRHAFEVVDRVLFLIGPDNMRSRRAIEKMGATYAGVGINGAGRPSVVYEITATMFVATTPAPDQAE